MARLNLCVRRLASHVAVCRHVKLTSGQGRQRSGREGLLERGCESNGLQSFLGFMGGQIGHVSLRASCARSVFEADQFYTEIKGHGRKKCLEMQAQESIGVPGQPREVRHEESRQRAEADTV